MKFYAVDNAGQWLVGELEDGQELATKHPVYFGDTIDEVCTLCDVTPDMWEVEDGLL